MNACAETIRAYGRRRVFSAGERICDRTHPLDGAYVIESGAVSPVDHVRIELGRQGLVLERDETFGEYALVGERPYPSGLRALTRVETTFLDPEGYARAVAALPDAGLPALLRARVVFTEELASLIGALRGHSGLRHVPPFRLIEVAKRGRAIRVPEQDPDGGVVVAADSGPTVTPGAWFFVARGAVKGGGKGRLIENPTADDLLARKEPEGAAHPPEGTQKQKEDTWLIEVDRAALDRPRIAVPVDAVPHQRVILAWSNSHNPQLVSALAALVAETQQRQEGLPDRWRGTLLVVDGTGALTPPQESAARAGVQVRQTTSAGFHAALAGLSTGVVYLDVTRCARAWVELNVPRHVWKVIFLHKASEEPPPFLAQRPLVRCAFLDKMRDADAPASVAGAWRSVRAAWDQRFQAEEQAYSAVYHPRTVRLRFEDATALPGRTFDQLGVVDRASIARIARALAERRVGLALGGGAAWGYAHIALLEALTAAKIPLDALSAVSFGSLVGGYYVVGNLGYVRGLIDGWGKVVGSMVCSTFFPPLLDWYLFSMLRGRYLEDLEVPFFPVALNLQNGHDAWTPARGTVAFGVRAASSMPGFLSPAIGRGVRAVDGAYVDNVPEGILNREGLHFVIASNVIAAPAPAPERRWWPFSWTLNPFQRAQDSLRSVGWLIKAADERNQSNAQLRFEPHRQGLLDGIPIWAFWKAGEITQRVEEEAGRVATQAHKDWLACWA